MDRKEYSSPTFEREDFTCFGCKKIKKHNVIYLGKMGISGQTIFNLNTAKVESTRYGQKIMLFATEFINVTTKEGKVDVVLKICNNCDFFSYWERRYKEGKPVEPKLLYPNVPSIYEEPNEDLTDEEKESFNEAKNIFDNSYKASGALLRSVLESLLRRVFETEETLGRILQKPEVQKLGTDLLKMCELARLIGNDASHPAKNISKDDKKEVDALDIIEANSQSDVKLPKEIHTAGNINKDDKEEVIKKMFWLVNKIAEKLLTNPRKEQEQLDILEQKVINDEKVK